MRFNFPSQRVIRQRYKSTASNCQRTFAHSATARPVLGQYKQIDHFIETFGRLCDSFRVTMLLIDFGQ